MIVWTVLSTEQEYQTLMDKGYLVTDDKDPECMSNHFPEFKLGYDWLSDKLRKKTNTFFNLWYNFKYNIRKLKYPRWVWLQVEGHSNPFDVDKLFFSRLPGSYKFIFFNIDPLLILLNDYDLWHYCLNRWHLSLTEEETNIWDNYIKAQQLDESRIWDNEYLETLSSERYKEAKIVQQQIINSWDNIFDLYNEDEYVHCKNNEKTIQGVTWVLRKKDIMFIKNVTITQEEIDEYERQFEGDK